MDRIREARRGSMAAVNGSLSRRRQRSSGLRDSPEDDGVMEMQETSRLRDRGGKKDRDRDRSGRNKRRRGDRMLHGSHREEGEDSSEESVDEDEDDEEDDSSVAVRLQPSLAQNPAPAASVMQSHNIRKGYPVKPVRPPGTCTWKVAEEMIGAPIPRKARSSSVKRSQECSVSGGGGGCGGGAEQVTCPPSMSPARRSPSSTAPVSPSSSNASIRKKMKPISVPKPRPPKSSKSSSIQEIEIEVAEVLFGMTRQIPSKQEDHRHDSKESNGSGNEVKSRVSSPNPISPPATSQPSAVRPANPSINSFPLTATAPKRKRPRMRIEDESPTSPPNSTALPATSSSSVAKLDTEAGLPPVGTKNDPASPRPEKNASPAVENGGFSSDQAVSNTTSATVFVAKAQQDSVKTESLPDLKDTDNRPEKKAKEEAFSPPKESPATNLDVNIEEASASKASMISDSQREEKFSIDLMAPPGKSSPEIESNSDYVVECKPIEMENTPKPEVLSKAEGEKIEKKSKSEAEEIAHDDKNGGKPSTDDSDLRKPAGRERNLDLQLDLEKLDKDVTGVIKHQGQKQQSKAPRTESKAEKAGPTASLPMPMQITGWPGGFPPFGFMGQVPPLPPVVPVDGTSSSSKLSFLPSPLRPKRCAAHCYIAQNIHYHQQITRLNPFWPSSAGAAPLFASKQYNLNTAPPSDSTILGSPLQGNIPGKSLGSAQEKGLPASAAHSVFSGKDKSNAAPQFMDVSQRKPPALPQSSQPGSSTGNMLAPAFIFPINPQQAAVAGAAATRSGVAKLTPGSGNTAQSSSSAGYAAVGASGANGSGTSMSFNYPGLAPNEAQYLAFLQNNAYSFPIPAHVGGAQTYRGASPAQAMPFFNLSFYPSQILHPSQIRLQQQLPSSQQPPYSQQGHQNPSTSSGSSSSQKNTTQQSQRVPATAATAITVGNSHGFPPSKQHHLSHAHQVRQLEPEPGGEDAPSTADSRVSQAQKNIYAQKFTVPTHSQNFALITPAAAALGSSGVGTHGEKQQQQQQQSQNQVMKVDLTPSQAFAMSFATFGGAAAASAAAGGAAPHGLDFSSMAQNHAIFQSLPETVRHSYQVSAVAAAAHSTQQQQQNKKPEDVKSAADMGNASGTVGEEGKISSASKVLGTAHAQQHSLSFSRADADSPISSILTNNVIDSSSRTLNLIQPPPSVAPRASSRPASAAPASNSIATSSNSQHLLSQQQVLPLPKQVQQYQLQQLQHQQLQQQQQRVKPVSSHSSASLYADRMPGNSTASKFSPGLAGFPPALIQSSASSQPTQWKASTRAANPSSTAALAAVTAMASPSASTSVKNQIPLQQQVRSQQPPAAHQTHQISFGPAKVASQSSQHLPAAGNNAAVSLSSAATIAVVGSPQNSVSKSSSSSPHSSAITKSVPPSSPVLPVLPFQKQQSVKNSSSSNTISPLPATSRNLPSILGNPHMTAPQNLGSKPQQPSPQHLQQSQMPKQHSPQAQTAQLFFSYPYMQSQTSQNDAAAVAAAGYFQQHHRRAAEHPQRQNSTTAASTGMLSLGPSPSLSLAAAQDPSKGAGAAAATNNNSKNLMPASLLQHPGQFATISQPGSGANAAAAHPLMYIHAMQSVPLKPDVSSSAEQKPAAGR